MRKRFFLLAFVALSTFVNAYEVGDWFIDPQSGIPSVVVYVDETGEHGMIMAPAGGYRDEKQIKDDIKSINHTLRLEKRYLKIEKADAIKKGVDVSSMDDCFAQARELLDAVSAWLPNMPLMPKSKVTEKQERDMLRNIAPLLTGFGAQDQQTIIDYCEANNVNLQSYFYSIDWALRLGDGWFIPGNYDLELFARGFSKGLGVVMNEKEAYQSGAKWAWKHWMLGGVYPKKIRSSTFIESSWEETGNNKGKTATVVRMGTLDFNYIDNYYVLGYSNEFGKIFYALLKNDQSNSYFVAFKYF